MEILILSLIILIIFLGITIVELTKSIVILKLELLRVTKQNMDYAEYNNQLYNDVNNLRKELEHD